MNPEKDEKLNKLLKVDIFKLIAVFCAMIVTFFQVLERPGSLASLLSLVAVAVGFGATLAFFIIEYYKKPKPNIEEKKSDKSSSPKNDENISDE